MSQALAQRPASAIVAQAAGDRLPSYVTREQARAIINATTTTVHRLLLECLWQSGGRVSEVLRLRLSDIDPEAPLLHLVNMKQRKRLRGGALPRKVVVVSADLVAQLRALARDARIPAGGYFFRSQKSQERPMSYGHCWRLIRQYSIAAGIQVIGSDGQPRPSTRSGKASRSAKSSSNSATPVSTRPPSTQSWRRAIAWRSTPASSGSDASPSTLLRRTSSDAPPTANLPVAPPPVLFSLHIVAGTSRGLP
jgi:integrase